MNHQQSRKSQLEFLTFRTHCCGLHPVVSLQMLHFLGTGNSVSIDKCIKDGVLVVFETTNNSGHLCGLDVA